MDNTPDLWEGQIARLLRSYREPAVPEARLREIGEDIARRLAGTGAVEANLNAVLTHYKEPEIDAGRLAQIGRNLASQLQPAREETPRRLRAIRRPRALAPSNRAPLLWGLATAAAAVFLLALLANVFTGNPPPRPNRQEAKAPRVGELLPERVAPPPAPRGEPKAPVIPDPPKEPGEKPKEPPAVPVSPAPAPPPTPRPVLPPEPPKPAAPTLTVPPRAEVARLVRVQGEVFILGDAGKTPARAGDSILPACGLQTADRESSAIVRYADTTQVELGPETTVSRFDEGDKKVAVTQGIVTAQIFRQPAGHPMIFTTPHAEAKVVGTKLTLWVRPDWTRLEVKEGRVRFTRSSDGTGVDVGPDQYAVAVAGLKPVARRTLPATLKGIHLLEDFEDPLGLETRWQPLDGGGAPRSTLGSLEIDLSPRPNESYAAGGWHAPWGLRTRQSFALPLRISVDVENTEKHPNANTLVVLIPKDQATGAPGNEIAVHLRAAQYGILVGGQPVKTVDRNWTPPLKERWTIEFDRKDVRFSADGRQILRHAHGLQVSAEYRLELHGGAKMDAPAGARLRYDNVRIEP